MNLIVNQCEGLGDRLAILQVRSDHGIVQGINKSRDSSYAEIYYPWNMTFNPHTHKTMQMPPGGHVAGSYARSDRERGVHQAHANEIMRDIVNWDISAAGKPLEFRLGKGDHDILNQLGINVIRDFRSAERGIRVSGRQRCRAIHYCVTST